MEEDKDKEIVFECSVFGFFILRWTLGVRCWKFIFLWYDPRSVKSVFIPGESGARVSRYAQDQPVDNLYSAGNGCKIITAPFAFQKRGDFIAQKVGDPG